MEIGKILNKRRQELGLTLEEVGNAVGVSKSTVKKWEDGYISNMRRDKISELAKILKLSPVTLITGEISDSTTSKPAANALTPRQERIVQLFDELTEPQQDNIIGRAEMLAEQNENEHIEEDIG